MIKDHEIAQLVNELRDVAKVFYNHQSLRQRISMLVTPILKQHNYNWLNYRQGYKDGCTDMEDVLCDCRRNQGGEK